jgi:DNA mismatch repair protein MLH1
MNDEYNRILDVVSRYAVHSAGIGFSCKKVPNPVIATNLQHGDISAGVTTQAKASVQDNIRTIYGSSIANELIPLTVQKDPLFAFQVSGYITNSNYHTKKTTFLLFINSSLPALASVF